MVAQMKMKHNDAEITYNEDFDRFEAVRGDRTFYDPTLSGIKKKLDRAKAAKFTRIKCILSNTRYNRRPVAAEITSYDGMQARVSYKSSIGNPERSTVYQSSLYDDTDENRALFANIEPLQKQLNVINTQLYELAKKLTQTAIRAHYAAASKAAAGEEA